MNKHIGRAAPLFIIVLLAALAIGVVSARDPYIENGERGIFGCAINTSEQEVCIQVNGTLMNAQNGSSHKAFAVAEGTQASITVDGVPITSGGVQCFANQGTGNGQLNVSYRANAGVVKAGKAGGGLWVQANSAGRLICNGFGASVEVYRNRSAAVRPITAELRTINGCGLNNAGDQICVALTGMILNAQAGSSHKAFFVAEGSNANLTINGVPMTEGAVDCVANQGTGNGTLGIRASVQRAGKRGGGLFSQANSAGNLICSATRGPAAGASFQVD